MEPVLYFCAITAFCSLVVSLILAIILFKVIKRSGGSPKYGRKKSREERRAGKEERLYLEGVENILGYWPIEKEVLRTENGKPRDF